MNREIKFRAWLPTERKWYEVDITDSSNIGVLNCNYEYVLCQFTGLKDKNGKEIYEGDILREHDKWYPDMNADIFYEIRYVVELPFCGFCGFQSNRDFRALGGIMKRDDQFEFEVIGDIYENPELLGGNK